MPTKSEISPANIQTPPEQAREYTLDRKQFGAPLASNQLPQKKMADMSTEIALGMQACYRVGTLMQEKQHAAEMISMVMRGFRNFTPTI